MSYTIFMFYCDVQALKPGDFKRLIGVKPATFPDMCLALQTHLPSGGRQPKLCVQDRLLMTLIDWREDRTGFHIAQTYGLSEATVRRTIRAGEDALLRSGQFSLPDKKALTKSDIVFEVVVVDATGRAILLQPENPDTPPGALVHRYHAVCYLGST